MERQTQNTTTPSFRDEIESDILQQVRNEVQEALLLHAPADWRHEQCEAVEESVLDDTRLVLGALSVTELHSPGALRIHIGQAMEETKRLIHQGGVRTNS